jgi:signal transduction histidine kinase
VKSVKIRFPEHGPFLEGFFPADLQRSSDQWQRGRLLVGFCFLGFLFGLVYTAFYLAIGHTLGALTIGACGSAVAIVPWFFKRTGHFRFCGHLVMGLGAANFAILGLLEGGLDGHAMAWMAAIPLCALLLLDRNAAFGWSGVCVGLISGFGFWAVTRGALLPVYDPRWHTLIGVAGYAGLVIFLGMVGWIFESGRRTAQQKMEETLDDLFQANERLIHLNNEKSDFLAMAAHDLRNPLTVLVGSADMIHTSPDTSIEEIRGHAERILTSAHRMQHLLNELLDIHAIEEGNLGLKPQVCDLRKVIAQAARNHHQLAAGKQITVESVLPGEPVLALADERAISHVLDNLLSNAVKFSPPRTRVVVEAFMEDGGIDIRVKDQGPGITWEDQGKLFKKFSRASALPTGGESSTGLGLSIVKRMVEAMEGTVTCQSRPGEGAVFTVTLPPRQSA